MSSFTTSVARRYLSSKRHDSFISLTAILAVVSIGLGVCALIVVMSIMNGFRAEILDKLLGYNGHAIINLYPGAQGRFDDIAKRLEAVDGVVDVVPFIEQQVLIKTPIGQRGALVRAMPDQDFTDGSLRIPEVNDGSLATAVEEGGLVLGRVLASRLDIRVGDTVTLLSTVGVRTPFGTQFRSARYPVSAIVSLGVYNADEAFIGMTISDAQLFFKKDGVNFIELFVEKPDNISRYMADLKQAVRGDGFVQSWEQLNRALVETLATERVAMFMVLSLMILVAVFNIASSLFMLVKDKAVDIAIMRTMGASKRDIQRIFMIVGSSIGLFGVVAGSLLAWVIASNIEAIKRGIELALGLDLWNAEMRFISAIRVEADPGEIAITIAVAMILSFLATILPARRASKIEPVEILRYE